MKFESTNYDYFFIMRPLEISMCNDIGRDTKKAYSEYIQVQMMITMMMAGAGLQE